MAEQPGESARLGLVAHKDQSILAWGATRPHLVALWHTGADHSGRGAHKGKTVNGLVAHRDTNSSWPCGIRGEYERGLVVAGRVMAADGRRTE